MKGKEDSRRIFGKDITNHVTINKQYSLNETNKLNNQYNSRKQINPDGKNLQRLNKVKHQSMDENLLKSNLIQINNIKENVNIFSYKNNIPNVNISIKGNNYKENNLGKSIVSFNNNINNLPYDNLKKNEEKTIQQNTINPYHIRPLDDSNIHMKTISPELDNSQPSLIAQKRSFSHYEEISHYEPCLEYIDEIYYNLLKEEVSNKINYNYFKYQDEITEKMRIILIEWLSEVVWKFKLRQDTFFLVINIVDKFLSVFKIKKCELQLTGAASLLIACKYEEIYFPEVRDIVYICDRTYCAKDILDMEFLILSNLNYQICPVFPQRFLQILSYKIELDSFDQHFSNMMLELFAFDYRYNKFLPSLIACTCIYITMKIKKNSTLKCNEIIHKYCNNENHIDFEQKIKECAQLICYLLDNLHQPYLREIRKKYSRSEYGSVANFKIFN